ncbi:LysR family transcriptional regulator [Pollutimonas nitritireducens]|uniref:LysR family transcriptional regulator n=1 Tax=Pollutimonas nitritireducens TaxID=2045209 RepID=A0A2N4UAL7_9BURK|nr:LysR family transcriptional regulator [Pollutimonas nitritireducens]PLC52060.1 LysR family transcriptional regulator [Pollutimonas nitritireducens]
MSGPTIHPSELAFFSMLASCGALSAAARKLGITTPAVSKRLAQMEARLGVTLVTRTTRRMHLTPEGELYLLYARRILAEIDDMEQSLAGSHAAPRGLLRVNATPGFGRRYVAPVISRFMRKYPEIEIQLQLSVDPPAFSEDAFDVGIRFGEPPEARIIARRLTANRRLLCASPGYLAQHGAPGMPADLAKHNCIGMQQGDEGYGVWRLTTGAGTSRKTETVRIHGTLRTNDGEAAVNWALDGHGILMRAEWDISRFLSSGRLVQVLKDYQTPDADIYAIYPQGRQHSARVRAFVEFMADSFDP